ncbi:MAG TPA: hypothetical protein PK096_00910 [Candidatus Saccharibacteria bacterium]|nr:hypothetical protein [Candidatus Saccharibacteria bacterium]HRK93913.1 hypothetical protein [Candidatus Saccharibacteria bacterium]
MIIVWALSWWYGAGWKAQLKRFLERLDSSYDYFSIGLLLRSLFAPFRQISAGKVRGPINIQIRAFADRLISRFIGAFVRLILIVVGAAWLGILAIGGVIYALLWLVVPVLPLVGFIFMTAGWVPTWE